MVIKSKSKLKSYVFLVFFVNTLLFFCTFPLKHVKRCRFVAYLHNFLRFIFQHLKILINFAAIISKKNTLDGF